MKALADDYEVQMSIPRSISTRTHVLKIYGKRAQELHDKLVNDMTVEYDGFSVICIHLHPFRG
jgi:hypothetical protein